MQAFRDTQTSEEQGAGGEGSRREPSMYDLLFSLYDKDCTLVPWKLKDLAMNITLRYLRPWGSQACAPSLVVVCRAWQRRCCSTLVGTHSRARVNGE